MFILLLSILAKSDIELIIDDLSALLGLIITITYILYYHLKHKIQDILQYFNIKSFKMKT